MNNEEKGVPRSTPTGLLTVEEAAVVGKSLRPVAPGLLKQPEKGRSAWWVSDQRYIEVSVFYGAAADDDAADDANDANDDVVTLAEVAVRGRLCRYQRGHGTRTSVTDELSLSTPAPASRLESVDDHVDHAVVAVAVALLLGSSDPQLHAVAGLLSGR